MHAYRILLPSETDDSRFNSREKHMLTDSYQTDFALACSVCTVKYQTSVFCMDLVARSILKKPLSDISQYRPHARSISSYYSTCGAKKSVLILKFAPFWNELQCKKQIFDNTVKHLLYMPSFTGNEQHLASANYT
jgi:hypothetical protein